MQRVTRRRGSTPSEGSSFSSVREFMQRTTPQIPGESPDEIPIAPAIMCHVFLLSCVLERTAGREAERHGLTLPQWMALGCIGNEGKSGITHSDLCGRLKLSKAPVTGIVDRLVRDGYAARTSNQSDRRRTCIAIKPKGEAAWRLVRDSLRDHAKSNCKVLSDAEQKTLIGLLSRLLESVSSADPSLPAGNKENSP